jgi:hypothetical protein
MRIACRLRDIERFVMPPCPKCAEDLIGNEMRCPFCNANLDQPRERRKQNTPLVVVIAVAVGFGGFMLFMLSPAVQQARQAARRVHSQNNLKRVGLAMHNYLAKFQSFPRGSIIDSSGAVHHGWEAQLLPYLNAAPLYNRIDFDKPWDDPANLRVFGQPLPVFVDERYAETRDAGGLPVSHYAANERVLKPNGRLDFEGITDGSSNTIFAGTMAAGARGWGTPFNLRDPALGVNTGPDSLGSPRRDGTLVLMGDGAVRSLSDKVAPEVMQALATPNGGEKPWEN